jgi:hypothetical protein
MSGECVTFDRRDSSGRWLRVADKAWPGGEIGWVAAEFIRLSGDPAILPITEPADAATQ